MPKDKARNQKCIGGLRVEDLKIYRQLSNAAEAGKLSLFLSIQGLQRNEFNANLTPKEGDEPYIYVASLPLKIVYK